MRAYELMVIFESGLDDQAVDDQVKSVAAQIAKHIFGVKVCASRVFDPLREEMYSNLGLRTINPTRVQASRLRKIIEADTDEDAYRFVEEFKKQDLRS